MQLPTILLLLSAGALHTTLALPTNLTNVFSETVPANETSSLDKRSSYGWLASYESNDWNCKGKQIGLRPKIHSDCIPFAPLSDNVGISWGSWPLNVDGLNVYSDGNCKVFAGKMITDPGYYNRVGPGSCVSVKKHGAIWGSVRNADDS